MALLRCSASATIAAYFFSSSGRGSPSPFGWKLASSFFMRSSIEPRIAERAQVAVHLAFDARDFAQADLVDLRGRQVGAGIGPERLLVGLQPARQAEMPAVSVVADGSRP
jgi:hypothetical protein